MKRSLLLAPILLASLSACGGSEAPDNGVANANIVDGNAPDAAPGATAAAVPASEFVTTVAISDMYEVEAGKIAQAQATGAAVKAFAKDMIDAHTATTADLKTILPTSGTVFKLPTKLDEKHVTLITELKAATPEAFDTLYLDQQTAAHTQALLLLTGYASGGDNAALKAFAAKTAPKVDMHLQMVKTLDNAGADDAKAE